MKFVGPAVPNVWLIFGHDVKRLGDLDLSTGACPLIHPNYFFGLFRVRVRIRVKSVTETNMMTEK